MTPLEGVLGSLTLLLTTATLLPLSRAEGWWVRGLDFPRAQIGMALGVLLLMLTVLLDYGSPLAWVLWLTTLGCLAFQLWWILPYTRFFPHEVRWTAQTDADNTVTVMTANVLMPNRNVAALLALVERHQPDLLVTLETDQWWDDQLEPLEERYRHVVRQPQDNLYGMHLYSRYPLDDTEVQFLVEDDVPSIHTRVTLPSGRQVSLHCLHPAPPSPTENETSSERDAELLVVGKRVADRSMAVIVTGDLNDVAWSTTTRLFRKLSGLLDPRVGRGMFNTFHAHHWYFRWPLDHLFHSGHFHLLDIQRLSSFGSDHFPVLVSLLHTGGERADQEGLKADADDRDIGREKLEAENVQVSDVHLPGELTPTLSEPLQGEAPRAQRL